MTGLSKPFEGNITLYDVPWVLRRDGYNVRNRKTGITSKRQYAKTGVKQVLRLCPASSITVAFFFETGHIDQALNEKKNGEGDLKSQRFKKIRSSVGFDICRPIVHNTVASY
jgi:hypothetical protein